MAGAINLSVNWTAVLGHLLNVALIVVLALVANHLLRRAVGRFTARVASTTEGVLKHAPRVISTGDETARAVARSATLSTMLRSVATATVMSIAALLILSELSINLAPLIAGAGIASIAIGFGAQNVVRDVLAGAFVLIEDQYAVGDIIDAEVASGTVERVTLRVTRLRDTAGTVWHIPNGLISRVGNKSQNWARALLDIVVAHDTDVRAARSIIDRVAGDMAAEDVWAARLHGEPDDQGVQALGPEGITLRIMIDTEPASQWAVERELRQRIVEAFEAEGVEISAGVGLTTARARRTPPAAPPLPGA